MMKRTLALLIGMTICALVAQAADLKVKAVMTTGLEDEPTTTFAADTPKVFSLFKTKGAQKGDKLRGVWIAEDVGAVAPANTKIDEKTLTLQGDTNDGDFSLKKPTKGWPAGKYRVEIYVNDELATTTKFTIKAAGKAEKGSEEPAEMPDEADLKSMTESSLLSFGRAVKKKDFSKFYEEIASAWQKETTQDQLEEAFKDFFDKQIDLPSAIKGMEPVFNHPAAIDSDGVLMIKGYYPTKPNRVIFELKYLEEEGDWKLAGVHVNLKE